MEDNGGGNGNGGRGRRRTPSVPMAALSPTLPSPYADPPAEDTSTMGPRTRDEVLLKTLARVERMDTELEVLVGSSADHGAALAAVRHDQRLLISDVKALDKKMDTVAGLLKDVLLRLP